MLAQYARGNNNDDDNDADDESMATARASLAFLPTLQTFLKGVRTQEMALKEQGLMYSRLSICEGAR